MTEYWEPNDCDDCWQGYPDRTATPRQGRTLAPERLAGDATGDYTWLLKKYPHSGRRSPNGKRRTALERAPMPKYVVRTGVMRTLGVYSASRDDTYRRGTEVVCRTERGVEVGEVLCEATEAAVAQLKDPAHGQIMRAMSDDDARERLRLLSVARQEFQTCQRFVEQEKLEMQLVDVEHLLGGERVVVYYLAENRIDFRELVRLLAADFQTRVEMRQIGVRDEAKLLADYGDCGKPVCCNTHLVQMPPVSMKMAKIQKATLDPTKISGRCGRLKCCLRYEYDTYEALHKELPPLGSDVVTARGRARVLAQEILAGQLLVETEDHRRVLIDAAEVLTVLKRGSGGGREPSE